MSFQTRPSLADLAASVMRLRWLIVPSILLGTAEVPAKDLLDMSLEELSQVEVTSVGRKSQKANEAAAAVFVITQDDIRRSGVTSIPEALRLAPGLQVARIDSNKWAISARGFNGRFANKLLVLMDGRSVYTPTFSGVYWEAQDTLLEDIERIEVIRGPGAALWGSNAVNGVINIITRSARDTEGGTVTAGTGSYEKRYGSLRYGARLGEGLYGRAYLKGFHRGEFDAVGNQHAQDPWDSIRGGFRIDRDNADGETLNLQGDIYNGNINQQQLLVDRTVNALRYKPSRGDSSGMNVLGRWKKSISLTSDVSIQAYYDHTYRNEPILTEERNTVDLDAQHRFRLADDHDIVWGLAYRWSRDNFSSRLPVVFDNRHAFRQLMSGFIQDEISLMPNQLKFTLGARVEHNDYTGFEGQPNFRLAWTPSSEHTLWAAVSRAVRIPSRVEDSARLTTYVIPPNSSYIPYPIPNAVYVTGQGKKGFRAETLWAYEAGYRFIPTDAISADISLFYNDYDRLRSNEAPIIAADLSSLAVPFANNLQGNTYGAEIALDWKPQRWVRLQLNYSYLGMDLHTVHGSTDAAVKAIPGANPQQQVSLRSQFSPHDAVDLDFWLRYVDGLPTSGFPNATFFSTRIPAYVTLDTRLAWRPITDIELALVGQNLLDARHPESVQELFPPRTAEVPRSFYFQVNAHF